MDHGHVLWWGLFLKRVLRLAVLSCTRMLYHEHQRHSFMSSAIVLQTHHLVWLGIQRMAERYLDAAALVAQALFSIIAGARSFEWDQD